MSVSRLDYKAFEEKTVLPALGKLNPKKIKLHQTKIGEDTLLTLFKTHLAHIDRHYKNKLERESKTQGLATGLAGYVEVFNCFYTALSDLITKTQLTPEMGKLSFWWNGGRSALEAFFQECDRALGIAGLPPFVNLKTQIPSIHSPEERDFFALVRCYCNFLLKPEVGYEYDLFNSHIGSYKKQMGEFRKQIDLILAEHIEKYDKSFAPTTDAHDPKNPMASLDRLLGTLSLTEPVVVQPLARVHSKAALRFLGMTEGQPGLFPPNSSPSVPPGVVSVPRKDPTHRKGSVPST